MAEKTPFPFLWGTATSSHQVEGNNTANDWWAWEQAGRVKQPSGLACDHYRLFRQDIDLIARLGHSAYRFSLEWSRFEPEENRWNDEAFHHYQEVFQELHARRIAPVVTLHHFTNPQWFIERGGWFEADALFYFNRYVQKMVEAYGSYVRFWITLNEPLVYLYHGFFTGLWPPGLQSVKSCLLVFRQLLKAHIAAYRTIHKIYESVHHQPVWVSLAQHMTYLVPCRSFSLGDRLAVFFRDWFSNFLFLDAAATGFLFFPGVYCEFLDARQTLDYLGINYYSRDFIRWNGLSKPRSFAEACSKKHHKNQVGELNSMGWEVYPDGLYFLLRRLKRYRLPIIISENGICTEADLQRVKFIRDHLGAVEHARREGVPVFGYFYWSLLDNFEWDSGFGPRFGIVEAHPNQQERKMKDSAQVLTETCRKLLSGGDNANGLI